MPSEGFEIVDQDGAVGELFGGVDGGEVFCVLLVDGGSRSLRSASVPFSNVFREARGAGLSIAHVDS